MCYLLRCPLDTRESLSENGGQRTPQEGNDDCVGNNCVKRTINSSPGAMWFGPRLGRRRRSGRKSEMNNNKIETIAEVMNTAPWALVSIPGNKMVPNLRGTSHISFFDFLSTIANIFR